MSNVQNSMIIVFLVAFFYTHLEIVQYVPFERVNESLTLLMVRTFLVLKAMLHEAIFLATCNTTNVALQVARKNSRVTPHFATAIVE